MRGTVTAMNQSELFPLLEDALRAQLATRCRRAYHHDMKNGLQGVYGGADALIRAARADKPIAVPLDQLVQFVRHAISNHEQGLERVLGNIAPDLESSTQIDVAELIGELTRFLMTDASRHAVRLRAEFAEPLIVQVNAARLRLAFLGLITDAIDSTEGGGDISLRGYSTPQGIEVVMQDARPADAPTFDAFALDETKLSKRASIVLPTVRYVVSDLGGEVECAQAPGSGRRTTLRLPRA